MWPFTTISKIEEGHRAASGGSSEMTAIEVDMHRKIREAEMNARLAAVAHATITHTGIAGSSWTDAAATSAGRPTDTVAGFDINALIAVKRVLHASGLSVEDLPQIVDTYCTVKKRCE